MQDLEYKTLTVISYEKKLKVSIMMSAVSNKWVVGLHGIQSNKEMFTDLFSQSFLDSYSKLAIDFIGFGESEKPDDFSYTIEDQSRVVQQVIEQLGVRQIHLIGHSLGGMTGTLLTEMLGDELLSFSNLEGNLVFADCGASRSTVECSLHEFENEKYGVMQAEMQQSPEASSTMRHKWLQQTPARVFYKTSESIVDLSKSEKLVDIFGGTNVRCMFMYGKKNTAKSKNVPMIVKKHEIPDAGHFMLIDNPDSCYKVLRQFINGE